VDVVEVVVIGVGEGPSLKPRVGERPVIPPTDAVTGVVIAQPGDLHVVAVRWRAVRRLPALARLGVVLVDVHLVERMGGVGVVVAVLDDVEEILRCCCCCR